MLDKIISDIPAPEGDETAPLKCLIFDSYYDSYLGVVVYIRIIDGTLRQGVIGTISAHMMRFDNTQLVRKHSEMYIDVGARDAEGVARLGIQVADPITWQTPYEEFGEGRAMGHGFDDRAGCAVLCKCLEDIERDRKLTPEEKQELKIK